MGSFGKVGRVEKVVAVYLMVYKLVLPKCDINSTMLVKAKETAKEERSYILSGMHCFFVH